MNDYTRKKVAVLARLGLQVHDIIAYLDLDQGVIRQNHPEFVSFIWAVNHGRASGIARAHRLLVERANEGNISAQSFLAELSSDPESDEGAAGQDEQPESRDDAIRHFRSFFQRWEDRKNNSYAYYRVEDLNPLPEETESLPFERRHHENGCMEGLSQLGEIPGVTEAKEPPVPDDLAPDQVYIF